MKRLALFALLICVSPLGAQNAPAPHPAEIVLGVKKVFLVSQSGDQGVFDNIEKRMRQWGRWEIVWSEEEADIIAVFADRSTSYGSIGSMVAGTGSVIPAFSDQRFLILTEKGTQRNLLTISCERRITAGYTAGVLVNRLKKRIASEEKRVASTKK